MRDHGTGVTIRYPAAFPSSYLKPQIRLMIFGDRPEFDEMMAGVQGLEGEINAL